MSLKNLQVSPPESQISDGLVRREGYWYQNVNAFYVYTLLNGECIHGNLINLDDDAQTDVTTTSSGDRIFRIIDEAYITEYYLLGISPRLNTN